MSNYMIGLGKDLVETNVLSEANAVSYKMNIAGVHQYSAPAGNYVYFQDKPYGDQITSNGMNVRVYDMRLNLIERKEFPTTNIESTGNTTFINYMRALPADRFVILTSGPLLKSSPTIDTWFTEVKSGVWPGQFFCNNYDVAYAGVYFSNLKKIVQESYTATDDVQDPSKAVLEFVWDDILDVGANGMPAKAINDPTEYAVTSGYEYKKYPNENELTSKLVDYNLRPGGYVNASGQLFAAKSLTDANVSTRVSFRWYQGATLKGSAFTEVPKTNPGVYWNFNVDMQIPADADSFTVVVSRYPSTTIVGTSAIKNFIMTDITHSDVISPKPAAVGTNGIKGSYFVDGTAAPLIMSLKDAKAISPNITPFNNVYEREFVDADYLRIDDYNLMPAQKLDTSFTRASDGVVLRNKGFYIAAPNEIRFDESVQSVKSKRCVLVELASTNLVTQSNNLENWIGAPGSSATNVGKLGDLNVWRVVGLSNPINLYDRRMSGPIVPDATNKNYVIKTIVRKGNSGRISFGMGMSVSGGGLIYNTFRGVLGEDLEIATTGNYAGAFSDIRYQNLFDDVYELQFKFNAGVADFTEIRAFVGPYASTPGQYIDVIGLQVENALHSSSFIVTGATAGTRQPDIFKYLIPAQTATVVYEYVDPNTNKVKKVTANYTNQIPSAHPTGLPQCKLIRTYVYKNIRPAAEVTRLLKTWE